MNRTPIVGLLPALCLALGACAGTEELRFRPSPLEVPLRGAGEEASFADALVSMRGTRGGDDPAREEIVALLRLDNRDAAGIELVVDEVVLLDGGLRRFGAAHVERADPAAGLRVETGAAALFRIAFPFPTGREPDLDDVSLRWAVRRADGSLVVVNSSFERSLPTYPDPYWSYWYDWGYWGPYYHPYGYHPYHHH